MALPPTTASGKAVLSSLTSLSKELKFYSDGFKATRKLKATMAEIDQIKRGISTATQSTKQLEKQFKTVDKEIKKGKELWDKLLSKMKGGSQPAKAAKAGGGLASIAAIAGLAVVIAAKTITDIQIQDLDIESELRQESEFQRTFQRYQRNVLDIRALNKRVDATNKTVERNNKDLDSISKQFYEVKTQAREGRKFANDALYETRQGRKIVEEKISKQALDIKSLKEQFAKSLQGANKEFQKQIQTTVTNLKTALDKANSEIQKVNKTVSDNNTIVNKVSKTVEAIPQAVIKSIEVGQDAIQKVNNETMRVVKETVKRWGVTVTPATVTPAQGNIYQGNIVVPKLATITPAQVTYSDFSTSDIGLQLKVNQERLEDKLKRENQAIAGGVSTAFLQIQEVKAKADEALREARIKAGIVDIPAITKRIDEIEKMDKEANKKLDALIPKLDSIIPTIAGIPLIPGKTADIIRPSIPDVGKIENAVGTAMCKNLKTGCGKQALDDAVGRINTNGNNNANSVLDKLNTGLNSADLAQNTILLNTINSKLGDQVEGGLSGKLNRVSKWLHLDRLLNIMTFAATVHNAHQLSSDLVMTLGQALSNVLSLIGIKDDSGSPVDIGQIINSSVANLVKGIVGEEQYTQISQAWAKANRIYQATTNVINSFSDMGNTLLDGLENIGGMNGKIGNALRAWGTVGEKAYEWFNPSPNYKFRFLNKLQNYQQGANTVLQVTQVPLDFIESATQFNESTTELVNAIKQEPGTTNGIGTPEAKQVKEEREQAKSISLGSLISSNDIFNANQ